jgi:hypothetical protein
MAISATYGTWTTSWPWPRVYHTGRIFVGLAVDTTYLSLFELYNTSDVWYAERILQLDTLTDVISVDVSGFGPFYLVAINCSDGPKCWYRKPNDPIAAGALKEIENNESVPRFKTSCNFKGQALLGGIHSSKIPWSDLTSCSVVWSKIGQLEFNPYTAPDAGFVPMPWDDYGEGEVYKLKRAGNVVVVYGDAGRALLAPYTSNAAVGFGLKELTGAGISSPTHVAGNENTHCFIDTNHDVWLVTDQPQFQKLGYREWMDELFATGDDVVVSYSSQKKLFYFSDGNQCFVLSEYGMGECNQCPTSVVNYRGIQAGFYDDTEDYEFRLQFAPMSFGTTSFKTLETLDFLVDYVKTSGVLTAGTDFKYYYNESFRTGDFLRVNLQGSVTPNITASEFKIKLKGTDYRSATALKVKDCNGTIKFVDKRMIRGTYASQDFA